MSELNLGPHLAVTREILDKYQQEYLLDLQSRVARNEKLKTFEMTDEQYTRYRATHASIQKAVAYEETVEAYIDQLETTLAMKIAEAAFWKSKNGILTRRMLQIGGFKTPRFPKP